PEVEDDVPAELQSITECPDQCDLVRRIDLWLGHARLLQAEHDHGDRQDTKLQEPPPPRLTSPIGPCPVTVRPILDLLPSLRSGDTSDESFAVTFREKGLHAAYLPALVRRRPFAGSMAVGYGVAPAHRSSLGTMHPFSAAGKQERRDASGSRARSPPHTGH